MAYIQVDTASESNHVCMDNVRLTAVAICNKNLVLKVTYTDGMVVTINNIISHSKEQLVKLISETLKVNPADLGDGSEKISYIKETNSHVESDFPIPQGYTVRM